MDRVIDLPAIVATAGTGLRVIDVVMASLFHQQTPDELAVNYTVPLAGVHAAFSYYYEHKAEIDTDIRQQLELADKLKEQHIANGGRSLN